MNALLTALRPEEWFSDSYAVSRRRFKKQADSLYGFHSERCSWQVEAGAEKLCTDALWLGPADASRVLMFISGTHGVEAFCGSAIQSCLLNGLNSGELVLPPGCAVVMLHALNPWGMQWARRCTAEGIDLNRHFADFAALPDTDTRFPVLLDALLSEDPAKRLPLMAEYVATWGQAEFDRVFSGGQYSHDWAPFYGGKAETALPTHLEKMAERWQLWSRELLVLDLHSGLGVWGHGELISDHPAGAGANHYARAMFGNAVAVTDSGESCSVVKHGLLDYWFHQRLRQGCFLTLEFGTYSSNHLFEVLLSDHQFWRENRPLDAADSAYQANRQAMLAHFCPADLLWRQSVLLRAWQLAARVFEQWQT